MIILDNVDNADVLLDLPTSTGDMHSTKRRIDYFPMCDRGSVIITSRSRNEVLNFVAADKVLELQPMNKEHAIRLLQKKLGQPYSDESCVQLAEALDFMPLALSQAASFIRQKRRYTTETYLLELYKSREARTSLLCQHGTTPKRDRDASSSILLTWQISFEYIYSVCPSAAELLALMSCCDRQAIPEILIHDTKDAGSKFDDDIQMLEDFSFVSPTMGTTTMATWNMHRLVQDATQWWLLDRGVLEASQYEFIRRFHCVLPAAWRGYSQTFHILNPHIKSVLEMAADKRDVSLLQAKVLYKAARLFREDGLCKYAEDLVERSLDIRKKYAGEDHVAILSCKHELAYVYRNQGRLEEAAAIQEEVVEKIRQYPEPDHGSFVSNVVELSKIYKVQRRLAEAEALLLEAVKICEENFRPEATYTISSKSTLSLIYIKQKRLGEAETLLMELLEVSKKTFVLNRVTFTMLSNLALVYRLQGQLDRAKLLYEEVLEMCKKELGPDHVDTFKSMTDLVGVLRQSGRASGAITLMQEVVERTSAKLGPNDPTTLRRSARLRRLVSEQRAVE